MRPRSTKKDTEADIALKRTAQRAEEARERAAEAEARALRFAPTQASIEQAERLRAMRTAMTPQDLQAAREEFIAERRALKAAQQKEIETLTIAIADLKIGVDPISRRTTLPTEHASQLLSVAERAMNGETSPYGIGGMAWLKLESETIPAQPGTIKMPAPLPKHQHTATSWCDKISAEPKVKPAKNNTAAKPTPKPRSTTEPRSISEHAYGTHKQANSVLCSPVSLELHESWADFTSALRLTNNHVAQCLTIAGLPTTSNAMIGAVRRLGEGASPSPQFRFLAGNLNKFISALETWADSNDKPLTIDPARKQRLCDALLAAVPSQDRGASR